MYLTYNFAIVSPRMRTKTSRSPRTIDLLPTKMSSSSFMGGLKQRFSRLPIPSCVVMGIREAYPDPENIYTGFRSKKQLKK
jgi:hypothetical protein